MKTMQLQLLIGLAVQGILNGVHGTPIDSDDASHMAKLRHLNAAARTVMIVVTTTSTATVLNPVIPTSCTSTPVRTYISHKHPHPPPATAPATAHAVPADLASEDEVAADVAQAVVTVTSTRTSTSIATKTIAPTFRVFNAGSYRENGQYVRIFPDVTATNATLTLQPVGGPPALFTFINGTLYEATHKLQVYTTNIEGGLLVLNPQGLDTSFTQQYPIGVNYKTMNDPQRYACLLYWPYQPNNPSFIFGDFRKRSFDTNPAGVHKNALGIDYPEEGGNGTVSLYAELYMS